MASDRSRERRAMVERQIRRRGVRDERVLGAMNQVPREMFVSADLAEFAYEDNPLPIEAGQTISQPYIVALMIDALRPAPGDRVLEIGAGSGYAAAVLSRAVAEVYAVERHDELAALAEQRLAQLGYHNVHIRHGDGSLGWPENAPYQGIAVAAGGPQIPRALLDQLAVGGRLVMPVGPARLQQLIRVTRTSETEYVREDLSDVRFVPLIGAQGWSDPNGRRSPVARLVAECAEPIDRIDDVSIGSLLERIGDARVVLLGESTHGTSEFYRMRARITRELILRRGFRMVAVEADWPDAAAIDRHVRGRPRARSWVPFSRFPTWMWRNQETHELVEWLRHYNEEVVDPALQVSFHGLDLYSLHTSAAEVITYLERVDPGAAVVARERYGCLTPWQGDPAAYGRAALIERLASCEAPVVSMLAELFQRRLAAESDGDALFDARQNARLVAGAERYYRIMYYGAVESWNLRDQHMFDTLTQILEHRGPDGKIVVWEHNSHIGDASATEMGARGEHNLGQLCRRIFADDVCLIGFGTDHGTVAAASDWGGAMDVMAVRPSHGASYERIFHDSGVPAFLLHLREPSRDALREELASARLERAIGVIYRPDTELISHYFQAVLPDQFDEYVWFDESRAIEPLGRARGRGLPDTYPFGP